MEKNLTRECQVYKDGTWETSPFEMMKAGDIFRLIDDLDDDNLAYEDGFDVFEAVEDCGINPHSNTDEILSKFYEGDEI